MKKNKELIERVEVLYRLKNLDRSGWNMRYAPKEKIASHIWGCLLLAKFFVPDDLIDKKKLYEILILHETAEAITGDVVKYLMNKKEKEKFREVEKSIEERLVEESDLLEEFDAGLTKEGKVAKIIDKFEAAFQAYIYQKYKAWFGAKEFLDNTITFFEKLIKKEEGELKKWLKELKEILVILESELG